MKINQLTSISFLWLVPPLPAAVLVENDIRFVSGAFGAASVNMAQSFTVPADGTPDWLDSIELSLIGQTEPFELILLRSEFLGGAPLDSLTPGYVATSAAGTDSWTFSGVVLQPAEKYWAYLVKPADDVVFLIAVADSFSYPGGDFYLMEDGHYVAYPTADLGFTVHATEIPEPRTAPILLGGVGLLYALSRRPSRPVCPSC